MTASRVGKRDRRADGLGRDVPSLDEAERDGVRAHAERAPLLADRLCEADDGGLGCCVVRLADVSVQAGRRGDVHDGAVLCVTLEADSSFRTNPAQCRRVCGTDLDPEVWRSGADESERCADVYFDDDVPCVVWCGVQHAVIGEPCIVDDMVNLAILSVFGVRHNS